MGTRRTSTTSGQRAATGRAPTSGGGGLVPKGSGAAPSRQAAGGKQRAGPPGTIPAGKAAKAGRVRFAPEPAPKGVAGQLGVSSP
eukprot:12772350-Heterocapsa_arctica.AAC.1